MAAKKVTAKKAKPLKAGDRVEWNSAGGKAVGKVVKKVTGTTRVKKYVAKATPADPQYLVQSEKSGGKAVHKPAELRKRGKP
jgi:hypothetical protein